MKKRFFCVLACAALLMSTAVYAAGGDRDDPLISLSYLSETFIPELQRAMTELISARGTQAQDGAQTGRIAVSAGGSVSLEQGRSFVLTAGGAGLKILRGSVVNAGEGAEAVSGAVSLNRRYIVCEDSAAELEITDDAVLAVAGTAEVTQGDGKISPFADVSRGDWFFDDVVNAYERGLVDGVTAVSYRPGGTLTFAQCVKLAACMHQLYNDGTVTLEQGGADAPWYESYAAYALENGIIEREFDDYNAPITRGQFVMVFYNALPEEEYARLNDIPDGSIPDVSDDDEGAKEIYAFYRAGILSGYTQTDERAEHTFAAGTTISRAEVAAVISRMFDAGARIEFEIN